VSYVLCRFESVSSVSAQFMQSKVKILGKKQIFQLFNDLRWIKMKFADDNLTTLFSKKVMYKGKNRWRVKRR